MADPSCPFQSQNYGTSKQNIKPFQSAINVCGVKIYLKNIAKLLPQQKDNTGFLKY